MLFLTLLFTFITLVTISFINLGLFYLYIIYTSTIGGFLGLFISIHDNKAKLLEILGFMIIGILVGPFFIPLISMRRIYLFLRNL